MLNLDFLEKGLVIVSPSNFVNDFSRNIFFILYSINWLNFIGWLSLLNEILDILCIAIVRFSGCNVMNFEINLIFLIKPFFLLDQKSKS